MRHRSRDSSRTKTKGQPTTRTSDRNHAIAKSESGTYRGFRLFVNSAPTALILAGVPQVTATQWSNHEKANVRLVNDFCAAWATRDVSQPLKLFADDAMYRMTETTPPVKGHAGVIEKLKSYVEESERVEFKVLETFASGPIVMNHRIDIYASKARPLTWEGVGVFLVQNGKIKEWSDYTIRIQRSV